MRDTATKAPSVRRLLQFGWLVWGGVFAWGWVSHGQSLPRITTWRAADGLPQSSASGVTLDARGNVWATLNPELRVARLDGFNVTTVSNTIGAPSRVYVSRSGQLWCVGPAGLLEQTGNGWSTNALPEVISEYRLNPLLRRVRPIPLLPLDRNRVLVLLPDQLLEYDSGLRRSRVIKAATDTHLRSFSELSPGHDDGAWISGARGLLRIPGPLRQISPQTAFEEFLIPSHLPIGDLQRPFEHRSGAVVFAAEDTAVGERVVVRFARGQWENWSVGGQNVRQAWSGADGELWAHTAGTVLRLEKDGRSMGTTTILQVGRVNDVTVDMHGAAWLATSDGLSRVAALPWRPAPGFEDDQGPAFAVTSDQRGEVVALTTRAVHWLEDNRRTSLPHMEERREEVGFYGQALLPLMGGSLFARTAEGNFVLDANGDPRSLPSLLVGANPLGLLPDGRLIFWNDILRPGELLTYSGGVIAEFARLPPSAEALGMLAFALHTRSGELWVGGEGGLLVRRGQQWTQWDSSETDTRDGALAAIELPDGRLLVGGWNEVREFDGRRWRVLRRGFDRVHGFQLARDGTIWVAAGSGLYRFKDNSWFVLGEEEGLPVAAVFSVFEDGSGRLWCATARGLSVFDPNADLDPPRAEVAGADIPERAGDTRALFILGGADRWRFTPAGRLMYSWHLDNDVWSAWRLAGSVQFTNLTAGTHRFSVRAMDPSGNIQAEPAEFEFGVALAWFKDPRLVWTSAALALLLIAMGLQAVLSYWRLKRSYAEVERQVAERSAALEKANNELLLSHKMRALGTLAAGVAHDFNNLLSIIRGSAQLLEGQWDNREKTHQRLQRIKTAVDQGAGLVRAMLGYSRGSAAPRKELDTVEVVQRAIRLLDERLQRRIQFQRPPGSLSRVLAPPEMLQQILLNLVQNAAEAGNPKGAITVEVRKATSLPADCVLKPTPAFQYIVITVRDQGVGIPPEILSRIFEPFFTTKGFSSRRGTGLGLSMVYEFAKELGAGIAVVSHVGQGTSFEILLPAAGGPVPTRSMAAQPTSAAPT